jgi:peptide-methionine (S)-S-oxide reductase
MESATLGGGCFWCLEAVFQQVEGVSRARSGYSGGTVEDPTYEAVCTGSTGHAEVVQVDFDPDVISYRDILEIFFSVHDPTTLNRQGADVGTQYRSAVFFDSPRQEGIAREVVADLEAQGIWTDPLTTEIVALEAFYPAEAYHEDYFRRNPGQAYCQAVINPKVAEFRRRFAHRLKGAGEAQSQAHQAPRSPKADPTE